MTTRCFKRFLFATLLTAFSLHVSFAQVFWNETFSDPEVATTTWLNGGTNAGNETWKWSNDPTAATFDNPDFAAPTAATGFFLFNSDANGQDLLHNVTLTGPTINCSASAHTSLTFFSEYLYAGTNNATLEVSINNGSTWTSHPLFDGLGSEVNFNDNTTVAIPEANGQSAVQIRFRWVGIWEYAWKIDDIRLENIAGLSFCAQNPTAIICDDLDNYDAALLLGPQSDHWTTWFGAEAGPYDATVSSEEASTAPNSVKIVSTSPGGGLQSAIFQMGGMSAGQYELKFKVFIPAGKTAYYDLRQAIPIVFGGNNLNVAFDSTNVGRIRSSSGADLAMFTYPHDEWFECRHIFDLDNDTQDFRINDELVIESVFTGALGGVLFMGGNAKSVFYIDDVALMPYVPVVLTVNDCEGAADLNPLFGGEINVSHTSALYDNSEATADPSDPAAPDCFQDGVPNTVPAINNSLWYTFTGDGNSYHLETVPCESTNYIENGDTQMAVYSGSCGDFTELLCNEDLLGADDYRSGLDIETVAGTDYHVLIDGWSDPANTFQATGEFCIQVTRLMVVACAEGNVGSFTVEKEFVCEAGMIGSLFTLDQQSYVLPTVGPVHGLSWAVTSEPVPAGVWPPSMSSYWGSFPVTPYLFAPNLMNNGLLTQDTMWYFTPVVVANAQDNEPATPAYLHDLDITDACYYVGASAGLFLLGELAPLELTQTTVSPTPGNNDGAIDLTVTGGLIDLLHIPFSSYTIDWNGPNGFISNTTDITGLAAGFYTAHIADLSECTPPADITIELQATIATKDPAIVESFVISPNPTSDAALIHLVLTDAAEVRIDVINTLGQTLQTIHPGKIQTLQQEVNLTPLTDGVYFLRLAMGNENALRRIVLQR
jgi:5-hydroxyisourate hydrolase-like protein (transthyretin family)